MWGIVLHRATSLSLQLFRLGILALMWITFGVPKHPELQAFVSAGSCNKFSLRESRLIYWYFIRSAPKIEKGTGTG